MDVMEVSGACVNIGYLIMGPIRNNVYLIDDGESCFAVDPTRDAPRIQAALGGRELSAIVLTHAHWDHVGAAAELRQATGARVIASKADAPFIDGRRQLDPSHRPFAPCVVDQEVVDGDVVKIGAMEWKVLLTPGHTPGSLCLFLDPRFGAHPDGAPVLVSGDTLFQGTHGRTDFVGGDPADMRASLRRLSALPANTLVLPGHEAFTTIAAERPLLAGQFGS